jgi:hypothetical protein
MFVETHGQGIACGYIVEQLQAKLAELDRHIAHSAALRARLLDAMAQYQPHAEAGAGER